MVWYYKVHPTVKFYKCAAVGFYIHQSLVEPLDEFLYPAMSKTHKILD